MTKEKFVLDERLQNDGFELIDLKLCKAIFVDNSLFPWVILVPRQNGLREIIDLSLEDQIILLQEISLLSKVMQEVFSPDKLNIAALGNVVSQLHIHIIARFENDQAWPAPVFGQKKQPYSQEVKEERVSMLLSSLKEQQLK